MEFPKPAFDVFALLHDLGDERIAEPQDDVLVTRRKDGGIVIAAWNLVEPAATGPDKTFAFDLKNIAKSAKVTIRRVDAEHGDTLAAWDKIGKPKYPDAGADCGVEEGFGDRSAGDSLPAQRRIDAFRSSKRAGVDRGSLK